MFACCARAASGHAAAPPNSVMNSRRLTFDHLVGDGQQRRRHSEAEHRGGLGIDDKLELGRLHDRQVRGIGIVSRPVPSRLQQRRHRGRHHPRCRIAR
jgi:hypothetical protein